MSKQSMVRYNHLIDFFFFGRVEEDTFVCITFQNFNMRKVTGSIFCVKQYLLFPNNHIKYTNLLILQNSLFFGSGLFKCSAPFTICSW